MNQIEITDHQVDVLGKALHGLLSTVITCPILKETVYRDGRKTNKLTYESEKMDAEALGDFAYIISEYCIRISTWVQDDMKIRVCVSFGYIHPTGGTNGSQLSFHIEGNLDGTDLIIVKKKRE